MNLPLYRSPGVACPYLNDRVWQTVVLKASDLPPELDGGAVYEHLLASGFRRSGHHFYQNNCPGCSACVPIRVDALQFSPSHSQRRSLKRNADLIEAWEASTPTDELYGLYRRYCEARHPAAETGREGFEEFLCASPVTTQLRSYRLADGTLVGASWLDVLPQGLSSVYFAFDPDHAVRSLGVYSALREIELCRALGLSWYYLGFWVAEARTMAYKAQFKPHQLSIDGEWVEP